MSSDLHINSVTHTPIHTSINKENISKKKETPLAFHCRLGMRGIGCPLSMGKGSITFSSFLFSMSPNLKNKNLWQDTATVLFILKTNIIISGRMTRNVLARWKPWFQAVPVECLPEQHKTGEEKVMPHT